MVSEESTHRAMKAGKALLPEGLKIDASLPWEREEGELEWLLADQGLPEIDHARMEPAEVLKFYGFEEYEFLIELSKRVCPDATTLLDNVLRMIDKVSGSQIPAGPLASLLHTEVYMAVCKTTILLLSPTIATSFTS